LHLLLGIGGFALCYWIARMEFSRFMAAIIAFCAVGQFQSQVLSHTHWLFGFLGLSAMAIVLKLTCDANWRRPLSFIALGLITSLCFWTKPVPGGAAIVLISTLWVLHGWKKKYWDFSKVMYFGLIFLISSIPWLLIQMGGKSAHSDAFVRDMALFALSYAPRILKLIAVYPEVLLKSNTLHEFIIALRLNASLLYLGLFTLFITGWFIITWIRKNRSDSVIFVVVLALFWICLNGHAFLHPWVHFGDEAAGYTLPTTILLLAFVSRRLSGWFRWRYVLLAGLLAWISLFSLRHVSRFRHSMDMVEWKHGMASGILFPKEETLYFEQIYNRTLENPGPLFVAGYFPTIWAVCDAHDVFVNDMFIPTMALSNFYQNSHLRGPMQEKLKQMVHSQKASLVFVILNDEHSSGLDQSKLLDDLRSTYYEEPEIAHEKTLSRLLVFRKR